MCRAHVAIIDEIAALHLLSGRKRIETRFYRSRRPPFDRIEVAERIYFKRTGGEIIGRSCARIIRQFHGLTPGRIDQLRKAHNSRICAPAHYWRARRHCRYGILIWIDPLEPAPRHIVVPRQYGSAWISLESAGLGDDGKAPSIPIPTSRAESLSGCLTRPERNPPFAYNSPHSATWLGARAKARLKPLA